MVWFLRDLARLARERAAIEELLGRAAWLKGADWGLDGSRLRLDADIEAHGCVYGVRLTYPDAFPASPPTVTPRQDGQLWSTHQYGVGGELCLEWGPDTWVPEVTGAQMLVSAHTLLEAEDPQGSGSSGERAAVPSRHVRTRGQELRGSTFRFLATAALREHLASLPPGASGQLGAVVLLWQRGAITAVVTSVHPDGAEPWTDPGVPPRLANYGLEWSGLFVRSGLRAVSLGVGTVAELRAAADAALRDALDAALGLATPPQVLLLEDAEAGLHLFRLRADEPELTRYKTLNLEPDHPWERRGPEFEVLVEKRVGIVGVGSAGSKVALALGRSGVRRFVLVDDDLFLPENISRHTLDWRSVGEHKVDAIEDQLALLSPAIEVDRRRIRLTGQESTASVAGALDALSRCDLIFDATADPSTFNQLGMIAVQYQRPLVWLEIYAGGIGGMVARYRPGKEPAPLAMRAHYHVVTAEAGARMGVDVPRRGPEPYSADAEPGLPIVASDADVAVIADHAARLAIDVLAGREPSAFPFAMYLVGLARGWIFEQPFQTIPVDVGEAPHAVAPEAPPEAVQQGVAFLSRLLGGGDDGPAGPS
ncbi:MAG: thiamine biosynthesis protein ThiF [Chloroflexota bacterium]|nr:MAG: thiamine biosynthesis protein ThiF [Chloroflexota bacterium]